MPYTVQTDDKFNVNACHTHEYMCIRMYMCVLIHMHAL